MEYHTLNSKKSKLKKAQAHYESEVETGQNTGCKLGFRSIQCICNVSHFDVDVVVSLILIALYALIEEFSLMKKQQNPASLQSPSVKPLLFRTTEIKLSTINF